MTWRIPSPLISAMVGVSVGVAVFECSIGLAMVSPGRTGWLMGLAPGDWTNHFLGWHLFRGQPWSFPLGATPALLYPLGTSVGMTDSIPLLAIPFKALHVLADQDVQYIGLWLLSSFALQGAVSALLMRTLTPSVLLHALGAAMFVLAPPLLARLGHPALTSHWLLLGCLWAHLAGSPQTHPRQSLVVCGALTLLASAIHPYLALMVVALVTAQYARLLLVEPLRQLPRVMAPLAILAVLSGIVMWQSGYFIVAGAGGVPGGLGIFSMNALGPIMPMGRSRLYDLPYAAPVDGQFEGYAYMGVGAIALAVIAAAATAMRRPRVGPPSSGGNLPLFAACTGFWIFALSPTITVGPAILLQYSEAWWGPLQQFRASGRFCWAALYLLLFLTIRTIVSRFTHRQAVWLLGAAVALQVVDASGAIADARGLRHLTWRNPLRTERFWAGVLPHYWHLSLYPTNLCRPPGESIDFAAFGLVTGRAHITLNAGVSSRLDFEKLNQYCQWQAVEFAAGIVDRKTLYVMSIRLASGFERRAVIPVFCTDMDEFGVCFARETYRDWQDAFDLNLSILAPLDELASFRETLDTIYRDDLHRSSTPHGGSREIRIRSLARYIGYRLTGCGDEEARGKILRELDGYNELRLCEHHRSRRLRDLDLPEYKEQMPARTEAVALLRVIADRLQTGPSTSTYVDDEGEAVWLHEYIGQRLIGRTPQEATAIVRRAILSISQ